MDLAFDAGQAALRRAARAFLAKACPPSRIRDLARDPLGYDRSMWTAMAEQGWLGWAFPASVGGGGGRFLDLVILEEELGRAAIPSPFFATVVLASLTIAEAGSESQQARWLPGIASGETIVTAALNEDGSRIEGDVVACAASRSAGGWRVDGTKTFVPYAHVARSMVCLVRTDGDARDADGALLLVVDADAPRIERRPTPGLALEPHFEVRFDGAAVDDGRVLGDAGEARVSLRRAQELAIACLAAEMLGGAEAVLAMTLEHAATRRQGGRPIGSHQALQHRCADVAIAIDAARLLVYDAAWRLDQGLPAAVEVSMAKAAISETYREATWLAALILGGTGFMDEHALGPHYRRAKVTELQLGDAEVHRDIVARALLGEPSSGAPGLDRAKVGARHVTPAEPAHR